MSDFGVKETQCTCCVHREVCSIKTEFLEAQKTIDEVYVSRPCEDGKKVGMIRIRDIKYIEPVELHSVSKLIRSRIIEGEYHMTINEYQKAAYRTANQSLTDSQQLQNGLMGLNGESGECIDILKKHLFQGHDLDKYHIAKELGDVAWYLAVSAQALGFDLETILQMNVEKLKARYPHGFDAGHSQHRSSGDI